MVITSRVMVVTPPLIGAKHLDKCRNDQTGGEGNTGSPDSATSRKWSSHVWFPHRERISATCSVSAREASLRFVKLDRSNHSMVSSSPKGRPAC